MKAQIPFLVLSLLTGLSSAFITPIMSYFLVDELQVAPFYIGVYTVAVTLTGLVVSQYFGYLADHGVKAKNLYRLAQTAFGLALVVFSISQSFWWVLFAGVVFMSVGAASIPQMLTISINWAKSANIDLTAFNSKVRASISLAWILGPAIAFALVGRCGFAASFLVSLICVVLAISFCSFYVPNQITQNRTKLKQEQQANVPLSFYLVAIAVCFGFAAHMMFGSSMPLYVLHELKLPNYLPGLLMGLVAALEIPIMLFSARLSRHIGPAKLMACAFVSAGIFYIGMFYSWQIWQLVCLQIFNALFYGLYAGVGLTLLQSQLEGRTGFSSAFYANSMKVGLMIGTSGTGLIAQFSRFQYANIGALLCISIALISILYFLLLQKSKSV
ncbi:sugar efflux transporter [Saccharobesus litoralis]|uniref:sugar efflux transporter n=1 Tax=Saccharobesus litoralis TaxID=2172099 RepID=UPI001E5F95E9|nr:sugar efflux transporter [Saccharobesus litoralis]